MGPTPRFTRVTNRRGEAYLFSTYLASLMFVVVGAIGLQRAVVHTYTQLIEQALSVWSAPQHPMTASVYPAPQFQ